MRKSLLFRVAIVCITALILLTSCVGNVETETTAETETTTESETTVESETTAESESDTVSETLTETESIGSESTAESEFETDESTADDTQKETEAQETWNNIPDYVGTAEKQTVKQVNICCIGDSITDNCGTYSSYRYSLYTKLYMAGCSFKYTGIYYSADPRLPAGYNTHCGFSGAVIGPTAKAGSRSSYDYLSQYIGSGTNKADIVLVMLGHNNYFQSLASNESAMVKEYKNFLERIYELNPDCIIYCASMVDQDNGKSPDENYSARYTGKGLNTLLPGIVADVAAEGHEIYFVDLCNESKLSRDDGDYADGTHPSDHGQAKIAQVWYEHIVDRVKELNAANEGSGDYAKVVPVTGLNISSPTLTVTVGYGRQLTASVVPSNATIYSTVWQSSDTTVATVDEWGVVTGVKAGTAIITATSVDGSYTATVKVTVVEDERNIEYDNYYRELFSTANASRWEGDTGGFGQSNSFWGNGYGMSYSHGTITSKLKKVDTCFKLSFSYVVDGNYGTISNSSYTTLSFAGFELKMYDAGRRIVLRYNGAVIGEYKSDRYMVYGHRYGIEFDNGNVIVTRDGQILIEGSIDVSDFNGQSQLVFKFNESSRTIYLSELLLQKGTYLAS